jgi:hypothetical protein
MVQRLDLNRRQEARQSAVGNSKQPHFVGSKQDEDFESSDTTFVSAPLWDHIFIVIISFLFNKINIISRKKILLSPLGIGLLYSRQ